MRAGRNSKRTAFKNSKYSLSIAIELKKFWFPFMTIRNIVCTIFSDLSIIDDRNQPCGVNIFKCFFTVLHGSCPRLKIQLRPIEGSNSDYVF